MRVGSAHLAGMFAGGFNLHQVSFPDPRTPRGSLVPLLFAFHQFRPKGEQAALGRLDEVDRATAITQKDALRVSRCAQAPGISGPIHESLLEPALRHIQESGDALNIFLGEVNESFLLTAARASRLALEAHQSLYRVKTAQASLVVKASQLVVI